MWRKGRGFRRLADEVAEARIEQAELRRRLEAFEMIAAAVGAAVQGVPDAPVPPALIAAAGERRSEDVPVRLDVPGGEVFAVVGGPGDPREWWTAIWRLTGPDQQART
ncbi:MAG: hypothetical protein WBH47_13370 [Streptosporangiaceae bacterium]